MYTKKTTAVLISYLVASQAGGMLPANASDADSIRSLNQMLSAIAAKNGMISFNTTGPAPSSNGGPRTQQAPMPTAHQLINAIKNLPQAIRYPEGPPTPDPTVEEASWLDVPDITTNITTDLSATAPIFGTITQADESLTGLFDDLSTVDMTQFEPEVDPSMFTIDETLDTTAMTDQTQNLIASVLNEDTRALASASVQLSQPMDLLNQTIAVNSNGALGFDGKVAADSGTAGSGIVDRNLGILALTSVICPQMEGALEAAPTQPVNGVRLVAVPAAGACFVAEDAVSEMMLRGGIVQNEIASQLTEMTGGNAFFNPKKEQNVLLPNGHKLTLKGDSLAWVEIGDGYVKVRSGSLGVKLITGCGRPVALGVGEEVILVAPVFMAKDPVADGLGKRHVAHHDLIDGTKVYISEFSIPHFLSREKCFAQPEFQVVRERLMKSAAAISVACRQHGRYYVPFHEKLPTRAFSS